MTPEEIRSSYHELVEILMTSGLDWVVEQVDQTIRAGRAVEKPTKIFKEEEWEEGSPVFVGEQYAPRRAGKPTALMTLEPWPDAEQLLFLIDGLRQAIVRAAEVENEQIRLLRSVAAFETVSFEPDDAANERGSLKLVGIQDDRIPRLAALLDDLEREVRS